MDAMLEATNGQGPDNIAEWCRVNGVNPRTLFRHRERVRAEGSWTPRSRRPRSSPSATPPEVVAEIRRLRASLAPDNGADSIRDGLEARALEPDWAGGGFTVPSRATINRVLDREGLLAKNPAKRPKSSYRRFSYARPRDCYQIDATVHQLAGGAHAVAFDVIDDASRVWVASHVTDAETITGAIEAMTAAVAGWGAPALVLADNGTAFAHPHRHRHGGDTTRVGGFAAALADRWGTAVIHSSPYHPQTLGKNERLHQTAKKLLAHHWPELPADAAELAARLETVREHYNQQRRHSAIARPGIRTPAQAWQAAPAHGGPGDLPRQHDATVAHRTVAANGVVTLAAPHGGRPASMLLGRHLAGHTITVLRDGDHITVYTPDG
ncbi:integrase core domain-containing protein, partial [Actinomycetospora sp. NBRC 106375]|uniref:integrase core domain-containing protein n=1 Tax=Actinomycetospora sp. NBRC 106375 TaxID=3032207 RepID=UPI002556F28B